MNRVLSEDKNMGDKPLVDALAVIVQRLSSHLPDGLPQKIRMYVAGGVAVNLYTGSRSTHDVDASFSHRLLMPPASELVVPYVDKEGKVRGLHLDTNYNDTFALLHEDYDKDSWVVAGAGLANPKIEVRVLSPIDLAVSKISRYGPQDIMDIKALAARKLITPKVLEERATAAMSYFVGHTKTLESLIKVASKLVHDTQRELRANNRDQGHER